MNIGIQFEYKLPKCFQKHTMYNHHLSNVGTSVQLTGKWKMWLRYRDIGEMNLEHDQHVQQLQGYVIMK